MKRQKSSVVSPRAIDLDTEEIITLSMACKMFPLGGVSMATMARWLVNGVRIDGSKERAFLATIIVGGRRLTSEEAVREFIADQNP